MGVRAGCDDVMKDRYEEPGEEKGGSSNYFAMPRY